MVLLSWLNAYVVAETNMLAKTVKTVTHEAKLWPFYLPSLLNICLNTKPLILQYTKTKIKKRKCLLPLQPYDNCVVIFSFLLSQSKLYVITGASVLIPKTTPIAQQKTPNTWFQTKTYIINRTANSQFNAHVFLVEFWNSLYKLLDRHQH